MRVERKKYSIAVHFRGHDSDALQHTDQLNRFVMWARQNGLDVLPRRKVIEARVPGGGKRDALRAIAAYVGADRILYAGDDTTDFDALTFATQRGSGYFVVSSERAVPPIRHLRCVGTIDRLCYELMREIDELPAPPPTES